MCKRQERAHLQTHMWAFDPSGEEEEEEGEKRKEEGWVRVTKT